MPIIYGICVFIVTRMDGPSRIIRLGGTRFSRRHTSYHKIGSSPAHALSNFAKVFTLTMEHLQDLGGRVPPSKSKIFDNISDHRQWLAAYLWPTLNETIAVVNHMRDLGASLSTTFVSNTSLSRARLRKAIEVPKRIRHLAFARRQQVQFILACAHAQAFYGCGAS